MGSLESGDRLDLSWLSSVSILSVIFKVTISKFMRVSRLAEQQRLCGSSRLLEKLQY